MTYDVDYFIDKFQAIPEEQWGIGKYDDGNGRLCVLAHAGLHKEERVEFWWFKLFVSPVAMMIVNDGGDPKYQQPTPKQRVLAALRDIKARMDQVKQ